MQVGDNITFDFAGTIFNTRVKEINGCDAYLIDLSLKEPRHYIILTWDGENWSILNKFIVNNVRTIRVPQPKCIHYQEQTETVTVRVNKFFRVFN